MSVGQSLSASIDGFVPTLCGPMHLVEDFNGIAGAVTAIEGAIGEIPIFNIFIRHVLMPSRW